MQDFPGLDYSFSYDGRFQIPYFLGKNREKILKMVSRVSTGGAFRQQYGIREVPNANTVLAEQERREARLYLAKLAAQYQNNQKLGKEYLGSLLAPQNFFISEGKTNSPERSSWRIFSVQDNLSSVQDGIINEEKLLHIKDIEDLDDEEKGDMYFEQLRPEFRQLKSGLEDLKDETGLVIELADDKNIAVVFDGNDTPHLKVYDILPLSIYDQKKYVEYCRQEGSLDLFTDNLMPPADFYETLEIDL
jgi:hypothetical protein